MTVTRPAAVRDLAAWLDARGWAIGPTVMSIAASGTAAGTTFVVAWGIGAAAFGHFTLVLSIALIVVVVMLMSLNYVMYQELPRTAPAEHAALVSTALYSTLILAVGVVTFGVLASRLLTAILGVDDRTLYFALALALALTINQLTESFLRGLLKFAFVARLKLIVACVYLLGSSFCLVVLHIRDAEFYLIGLIVTNIGFAVVAGTGFSLNLRSWSPRLARSLYRHGAYLSAVAALMAILFGVDVIFLNHWSGRADVGIYSVYNGFPKRLLGVVFTDGIGLVLLPALAVMEKPALLRRIGRLAPVIAAGAGTLSFAASSVFFLLLRGQYPYSLGFMALSAVGIGIHTVVNLYFFALSMDGVRGAKVFIGCLAVGVPLALGCQALFIAQWGLIGALVAFPLTNLLLLAIVVIAIVRRYPVPASEFEPAAEVVP